MDYHTAREELEEYVETGAISREALFTLVGNLMINGYFKTKDAKELKDIFDVTDPYKLIEKYPDVALGAAIMMTIITVNGAVPAYLTGGNANGLIGCTVSIGKGFEVKDKERQAING